MKKTLFALLSALIIVPVLGAQAQPGQFTAPKAFSEAPLSIFPSIDKMTRLDMIDYFNSGSPKPSKNMFKGDCRILSADDSQITISTSEISNVEMSLIPLKTDTIVMVITTLKTPQEDSTVKFYRRNWEELTPSPFAMPELSDWMLPQAKQHKDDIENMVPFILARITYNTSTATLTLKNNTAESLPEEAEWAMPLLRDSINFNWNGKKMVKAKE